MRAFVTGASGFIGSALIDAGHPVLALARSDAVETFGGAIEGSGRPLVIASGGPVGSEQDTPPAAGSPRIAGAQPNALHQRVRHPAQVCLPRFDARCEPVPAAP
ncbi:hypothetical protein [Kutzneria sp. CA-103260]|uniref:hypothetical protein n=1 Tax=Kutzneria sp. CA-103260 TaxID=2802641 RepID=UPI001BEF3BEA|nr:hypothetical protein [Kutzneria sp. CA-103260]QUQ63934.1 hypothetical protein JJ691_16510 [Kutzneria sp. CA-103260]